MSLLRRRMMYKAGELPAGYTHCKYLKSTGGNCINTKIIATGASVEFKVDLIPSDKTCVFWTRETMNYITYGFIAIRNTQIRAYMGTPGFGGITTPVSYYSGPITVSMGKGSFTLNGKTYSIDSNQRALDFPIYLFALTNDGKLYKDPSFGKNVKIYFFKIYKNEILVFNGIPALDQSGRPCMFDTVTQKPFYNEGTGEFLYELA